jgi:PAS domain S-box-containing protein
VDVLHGLSALHDHLPAGVVVHAADGRIVSANRLAQELLGRSEDELIGIDPSTSKWPVLRDDGLPLSPDEFPAHVVLRTGLPLSGLVAGIMRPGSPRWVLCNAYPEHDAAGRVRHVVVCFTDCTALKATQESLEKSEERLRLVLKGSTDGPWDWNLVTGDVYYSERWWDMLGYGTGEGVNHPDAWRHLLHPEDMAMINAYFGELLPSPREGFSLEFRLRHRDGHYVPSLSRG